MIATMIMTDQQFVAGLVLVSLLFVLSIVTGSIAYRDGCYAEYPPPMGVVSVITFIGAVVLTCVLIFNPITRG